MRPMLASGQQSRANRNCAPAAHRIVRVAPPGINPRGRHRLSRRATADGRPHRKAVRMTKLVNHLLARALIAASRGNNYRFFIVMARLAARLAEGRTKR